MTPGHKIVLDHIVEAFSENASSDPKLVAREVRIQARRLNTRISEAEIDVYLRSRGLPVD